MQGQQAFRFTSPMLHAREEREKVEPGTHTILCECPVGYVLRTTPWVYRAIGAHVHAENGALNPLESPGWLQQALSVIGSEKERLRRLNDSARQGKSDSAAGVQAITRGRR